MPTWSLVLLCALASAFGGAHASATSLVSIDRTAPLSGRALAKMSPMKAAQRARDAKRLTALLGTTPADDRATDFRGSNQFGQRTLQLSKDRAGAVTRAKLTSRTGMPSGYVVRGTEVTRRAVVLVDKVANGLQRSSLITTIPTGGAMQRELSVSQSNGFARITSTKDRPGARPRFAAPGGANELLWAAGAAELAKNMDRAISIVTGSRLIPVY